MEKGKIAGSALIHVASPCFPFPSSSRSVIRSQQPSPPPSSSSSHQPVEHLYQYPQHAQILGPGNRKASTASSILDMGTKRSSPSSLGEDTEGTLEGGGEEDSEEEEEIEEDDSSLLPAEEEEDEQDDEEREKGTKGGEGFYHQMEEDDF